MRLTHGRVFPPLLTILTLLLASCAANDPPDLRATVAASSKAAIKAQLAALCPTPLTDDELERAAQFVEENRTKGAVWVTGRLLRMHRETRICRGKT